MPSNVSPEYANAEKKYHEANTLEEKLAALQEMQSWEPKHKGAEKLRAEISKKIAKIKAQIEKSSQKKAGGKGKEFQVRKDGCGQIAVVGLPNSGKSLLVHALTGIETPSAAFPFTTKIPIAGMMDYNGAKVQIVDVPALVKGSSVGKHNGLQLLALIRNADAICVLVHAESAREELHTVIQELERSGIIVSKKQPKEAFDDAMVYRKLLIVINEINGAVKKSVLKELQKKYKVILLPNTINYPLSEHKQTELRETIFWMLNKILVFTKKPGQEPDMNDPLVLNKGATVESVAQKLHKDFARALRFVKVWGSTKFPGQRVSKNYSLKNNDIIEIYS